MPGFTAVNEEPADTDAHVQASHDPSCARHWPLEHTDRSARLRCMLSPSLCSMRCMQLQGGRKKQIISSSFVTREAVTQQPAQLYARSIRRRRCMRFDALRVQDSGIKQSPARQQLCTNDACEVCNLIRNECTSQRGETAEAREARIAATYEQALLSIQRGERDQAVVRAVLPRNDCDVDPPLVLRWLARSRTAISHNDEGTP